jgi:hypothetical protein
MANLILAMLFSLVVLCFLGVRIVAAIDDLTAAVSRVGTSVDALIAKPVPNEQAIADAAAALNAIADKADAATSA